MRYTGAGTFLDESARAVISMEFVSKTFDTKRNELDTQILQSMTFKSANAPFWLFKITCILNGSVMRHAAATLSAVVLRRSKITGSKICGESTNLASPECTLALLRVLIPRAPTPLHGVPGVNVNFLRDLNELGGHHGVLVRHGSLVGQRGGQFVLDVDNRHGRATRRLRIIADTFVLLLLWYLSSRRSGVKNFWDVQMR